jgi:hypothetical protein
MRAVFPLAAGGYGCRFAGVRPWAGWIERPEGHACQTSGKTPPVSTLGTMVGPESVRHAGVHTPAAMLWGWQDIESRRWWVRRESPERSRLDFGLKSYSRRARRPAVISS